MTTKRRQSPSRDPDPSGATLFWTDRALSDLEAIGDYISRDDPRAAVRWIDQLLAAAVRAALNPLAGRPVPEVGRSDVREVFKKTYRIVYRVSRGRIEILTVFEGHRLFPDEVDVPSETS